MYKFHDIERLDLMEILAGQFIKCINELYTKDWEPYWKGERADANFLQFKNENKDDKEFGTNGFMKSVAKEANIFLIGRSTNNSFSKAIYDSVNINGDMKILRLSTLSDTARRIAQELINDNIELLPDSMTIISKHREIHKLFKGERKSSDNDKKILGRRTISNVATIAETQRDVYYRTLVRKGQAKFRAKLLDKYNGTCVITGCEIESALEAAHIEPFADGGADTLENGLLLRADLHRLFDTGFMSINPKNKMVHFKDKNGYYNKYTHAKIPDNNKLRENLKIHWQKFQNT